MPNQQKTTNERTESIVLGMGCFWGAEKRLAEVFGVIDVESGYAGGENEKAGYQDVLELEKQIQSGRSTEVNHAEVIKVTFSPEQINLETILIHFWENHDPTQGDRQGNDIGTNYRSVIYTVNDKQNTTAQYTKTQFQIALIKADKGQITTEIAPLKNYLTAEDYHQNYLQKNPNGYCGLGGIGISYPRMPTDTLNTERQLIVFGAENCALYERFKQDILSTWQATTPIIASLKSEAPAGCKLEKGLSRTPTIILFESCKEVSRYTNYNGDNTSFWKWLGLRLLTPEQYRIAFEQGTEPAFTGSNLDEKRSGDFVDPITGSPLFKSDTKFNSGTGWPSFFNPVAGAITEHSDISHGMERVEVRSSSSGIHLGHVFNDGPAPSFKRYCINGSVLRFIPD